MSTGTAALPAPSVATGGHGSIVSIDQPILTPQQEQEKWLGEGLRAAQEKSSYMCAYIKQADLPNVIRYAAQMLSELRTNMLSPQNYYELYMKIYDYLQALEEFIQEEYERGRPLEEMYEVVQHTGCIVPRLYLLITVGSVYIKSRERPVIELFRDLVEMCKGVQHPTRGLFLRHYLLTMMKNKLPGTRISGSAEDDPVKDGGTVEDTAELILQNFKEMNWLWIRIEARSNAKKAEQLSRSSRERVRNELRVLVGLNIVRISELEGIDRHVYYRTILPRLLAIIVKFREPMAQQYILEVIIQVFPDEFHLYTCGDLLDCFGKVTPLVEIDHPLNSLMERLGNYAESLREGVTESQSRKEEKTLSNAFSIFLERLSAIPITHATPAERRKAAAVAFTSASFVSVMLGLAKLNIKITPSAYENIDMVLKCVCERLDLTNEVTSLAAQGGAGSDASGSKRPADDTVKVIRNLIVYVMEMMRNVNAVLDLEYLVPIVEALPFVLRHQIAVSLCKSAVNGATRRIDTIERAARLFELIAPLIKDLPDKPALLSEIYTVDEVEEFVEEQRLVCRVICMLNSDDPSVLLKMYGGVRKQLSQGGSQRIYHTIGTLVNLYMRLALRAVKATAEGADLGGVAAKALRYVYSGDNKGMLETLAWESRDQAFNLYLNCGCTADLCQLPEVSYDLFTAAFVLYEEYPGDTKKNIEMLMLMINALHATRSMPEETYDTLATKVCQYSAKLLKKHDQSAVVARCSHLFCKKGATAEDYKKVLECMQRSLKLANNVTAIQQVPLFVGLLNRFLHYYAAKTPGITIKYINGVIDLVREASDAAEAGSDDECYTAARLYYRNTTKYIRSRQTEDERWADIEV